MNNVHDDRVVGMMTVSLTVNNAPADPASWKGSHLHWRESEFQKEIPHIQPARSSVFAHLQTRPRRGSLVESGEITNAE